MEVRFFAPGNLVSNLDFVESIFGNGGDPYLPENDARLDTEHWSGHTGCVILAPQLTKLKKKDLGLPHVSDATDRQKQDGMCWESEDELYNDGSAFKITSRDANGVVVTLIADNYYGYCKKEVKTQISYAANLLGLSEQVPAKIVLLTDGASRTIKVGNQEIILKRTTPKNMATAGRTSGLVIQALRYLGKDHVNDALVDKLARQLGPDEYRKLIKDIRYSPAWIGEIFRRLAERND